MSEYAPLYTPQEKLRKLALYSLWLIPIGILYIWVIPWWNTTTWFLCHPKGYDILFKSTFVGVPSILLMAFLLDFPRNINIIRLGQYPLPDQKMFRPTLYVYGFKAVWKSYVNIILMIVLVTTILFALPITKQIVDRIDVNKLQQQRALQCQNPKP